ncbi:MAG: organomercurial lyase MerB [Actinomycetota bacterium]|nr:organomercurial lyase MerB [Actinomycetota bacterium]
MARTTETLAHRLDASMQRTPRAEPWRWLARPLLRLLADGQPVTAAQVAAATSRPVDEVAAALRRLPSAELDDRGRLVGMGLTLRPTPHRFVVDGRTLFTWCALDALAFPPVLGKPVGIASPCPATGRRIRIDLTATGVQSVDPPEAVVSVAAIPDRLDDVRETHCLHGHFFSSAQAASAWHGEHPDGHVLSVSEAFDLGRRLTAEVLSIQGEAAS